MSCNAETLCQLEIFSLLNHDDCQTLADVIDEVRLKEGETLFHAGDPGDSLFVVEAGEIELSVKDTAGQKIVLHTATSNTFFGEVALFDSKARTATAIALSDAKLLMLDRDDLQLLFRKSPDAGLSLLASLSRMLRQADNLLRTRVSRNVNEEMAEKLSALQRVADWIAWFSGSMQFLLLNGVAFIIWIALNTLLPENERFDPYPFGFLTMVVSLEAIFLSCFVLISQNRQAEKDHVRSDIEYEVNIKAELEVAHLHEKTDRIYEQMLEKFDRLERSLKSETRT